MKYAYWFSAVFMGSLLAAVGFTVDTWQFWAIFTTAVVMSSTRAAS